MGITTQIEKKYTEKVEAGDIVTIDDVIQDPSLTLKVSKRGDDSVKKTVNDMINKYDQVVRLPPKKVRKDVKLDMLKLLVSTRFDIQDQRKVTDNRLFAMFKHSYEIPDDIKQEDIDKISAKVKNKLLKERLSIVSVVHSNGKTLYEQTRKVVKSKMLNDWIAQHEHEKGTLIRDESEFYAVELLVMLMDQEKQVDNNIEQLLKHFPIYTECLSKIHGLGPTSGAMIISHLDIERAHSPGSFIRRMGITVEKDGKGTSRRKEHNVPSEYLDTDGNLCYKWSLGYDPRLRAWFLHVLLGSFIRTDAGQFKNPYMLQFANKKRQYSLRKDLMIKDKKTNELVVNKDHVHKMTLRWTGKIFLIDLWLFWAAFEGQEIKPSYYAKVNGIRHAGLTEWEWMVKRLGNPLDLREKIYGIRDELPSCYTD